MDIAISAKPSGAITRTAPAVDTSTVLYRNGKYAILGSIRQTIFSFARF